MAGFFGDEYNLSGNFHLVDTLLRYHSADSVSLRMAYITSPDQLKTIGLGENLVVHYTGCFCRSTSVMKITISKIFHVSDGVRLCLLDSAMFVCEGKLSAESNCSLPPTLLVR